jgi:hypothetical protein
MTECILLATIMEVSCKGYLLRLVLAVMVTGTMAVTPRPVLGVVQAAIVIPEEMGTRLRPSAMGTPATIPITVAAVGIAPCIQPAHVDHELVQGQALARIFFALFPPKHDYMTITNDEFF